MKKISAFLIIMIAMLMAGVCAHAADFSVDTTSLPMGEAYKPYSAQITMSGGSNDGYSFEFISGFKPTGLTVNEDGSITGTPTSAGYYANMNIRISNVDGTYRDVTFKINIRARSIKINVTAPKNIIYDGNSYTATVKCYDMNGDELTDVVPIIRYGKDNLSSVTDAGTYYIDVYVSGCIISEREGDTHIQIERQGASISLSGDKEYQYDQLPHPLTAADVTVTPPAAGYVIEYSRNGGEYTTDVPVSSGIYTARVHTTNPNYETIYDECTIKIIGENVNFTVTNTSFTYDGNSHKATVSSDPADIGYKVTYTNSKGETVENPTDADVYTIKITLDNDIVYSIGNDYDNKLTISPQSGHFTTDESWVYDGKTHKPNMTVDAPYDDSKYTITYRKQGTETDLTEITDVGVYDIIITFPNGNYIADATSSKTITVTPKTVNFTVTDNVVDYDGNEHTAKVTPTEALASDLYSVKYVKRDTETKLNSVTNAGVYDIVIELANSNYTLDNSFSATMTVNVTYTFNLGNSPAAMIYKDTTHDAEWQKEAMDYLKANHKFSENYLPKDCSADITYNPINDIDADGNEYTVITSGLDKFVDPGVNVNDGSTSDTIKGTVSAVSGVEGLYKVTYQINDSTMERYLLVVDRRIGDVNSDGAVNGIDANNLVGKDADANGVKQARIWDVNKDGRIDNNDVNAIRNRFSVRLEAYYPWL